MNAIRWGILSTGKIAQKFAETAAHFPEEFTVAAVASRSLDTAQAFASQYGIGKAYAGYEELARDPDVDIVYVATPNNLHAPNMKMCLEHGKHVLCEKPFTVNAGEAREVYAMAREKGLLVMEAFWTKFLPLYRRLDQLLAEGVIGDIHLIKAQYGYVISPARSLRKMDPELAGGALLDIGVYAIGFASMVQGYRPAEIKSIVRLNDSGVDEYSTTILRYEGGAIAECTCAIGTQIPVLGSIYGSLGMIRIPHFLAPQSMEVTLNDGTSYMIEEKFDFNGFEYQMREAAACLAAGRTQSDIMTPEQSIAVMEIMDTIRGIWGMRYPMEG